ncbi:MAG TPA: hypothetical protein VHH12_04525 [Mycobacterium sp.]|nr:hypothetical protein [Mycobacterium sp.]
MEGQGMGKVRRVLIALALAVVSMGTLVGATLRQPQDLDGIEVSFQQLNWRGPEKTIRFPNSRVGMAELSFDSAAADVLIDRGSFVNLVIQVPGRKGTEWAVQNLYLRYKNERFLLNSSPSVQFALPTANGIRVRRVNYLLTVTPQPLAAQPTGSFRRALVQIRNYRVGGFMGGGSDKSDFPLRVRPWTGLKPTKNGDFNVAIGREATTNFAADELPEINEDPNGCAPAGVARSLAYMLEDAGVDIGMDAQEIYEGLHEDMGTTEEEGTADAATMANGKQQFVNDNNLDVDTTLAGNGIGSIGDAMDTLEEGGDVEIIIQQPGIGHVGMIVSIVDLGNGTYQITYVDDPDQEDGAAENEDNVIVVDSNGTIISGGVGSIQGFLMENLNVPATTPTGPTGPGTIGVIPGGTGEP